LGTGKLPRALTRRTKVRTTKEGSKIERAILSGDELRVFGVEIVFGRLAREGKRGKVETFGNEKSWGKKRRKGKGGRKGPTTNNQKGKHPATKASFTYRSRLNFFQEGMSSQTNESWSRRERPFETPLSTDVTNRNKVLTRKQGDRKGRK